MHDPTEQCGCEAASVSDLHRRTAPDVSGGWRLQPVLGQVAFGVRRDMMRLWDRPKVRNAPEGAELALFFRSLKSTWFAKTKDVMEFGDWRRCFLFFGTADAGCPHLVVCSGFPEVEGINSGS